MSELLDIVLKTLDEKLGEDIVTIDMSAVSPFTDYFVIATARNVRHAQSLAEFVEQEAAKYGYDVRVREGEKDSTWVLVDLNEVIVHIFTDETRKTYRLEALWADQPQTRLETKEAKHKDREEFYMNQIVFLQEQVRFKDEQIKHHSEAIDRKDAVLKELYSIIIGMKKSEEVFK